MATLRLIRIEEVAEAAGVTRRTVRIYERVGLIESREDDLYPSEVVETIARIDRLRRDLGVNLAGVQVILEMRRKIEALQESLREVVEFVHEEFGEELERHARREEGAVVPRPLAKAPRVVDK
jgi:MerR family transcriptional regulator/heat shock protein HspR